MWLLFLALAWIATGLACAGVCRAAVAVGHASPPPPGADDRRPPELTLYETAYLAGGPQRLADVALVSMARQHRLLLAHTGWASVVDPVGRDAVERAVLAAIGPDGQRRIPAIRGDFAAADPVRALSDRLVAAGLALPAGARTSVRAAVRRLPGAVLLVLLTAGAALWMAPAGTESGPMLVWFALPLVLLIGTWATARAEIHPYPEWATPAGERLLGRREPADARPALTALAVHGRAAVADPALRAALHSSGA
ncbi:TIGR04222 domain-containing membrane protein [Streptomyces sp. NPDC053427]|uniref:TIGR04222 domain-containing membrane protein n=1 Tax=Streptomyces sp. NPDC053427 TaxID=3365701 RepID=UPI0037D05631